MDAGTHGPNVSGHFTSVSDLQSPVTAETCHSRRDRSRKMCGPAVDLGAHCANRLLLRASPRYLLISADTELNEFWSPAGRHDGKLEAVFRPWQTTRVHPAFSVAKSHRRDPSGLRERFNPADRLQTVVGTSNGSWTRSAACEMFPPEAGSLFVSSEAGEEVASSGRGQ